MFAQAECREPSLLRRSQTSGSSEANAAMFAQAERREPSLLRRSQISGSSETYAAMVELVDTRDLKSLGRKAVRVRVPLAAHLIILLFFSLFIFLLTSCGPSSGYFKIEGRFLHINQGELYVYSPDGVIDGMDTIKIEAGRFAYETKLNSEGTLMLVFPNFSEHPVFAESGGSVDIKADASHLKEMTVDGTDENELMNKFRKMIAGVSPPEEEKYAVQFIQDYPESYVSIYLVRKYFLQAANPDYQQAMQFINLLLKEQPHNSVLLRMRQLTAPLEKTAVGKPLPPFSATDVNGSAVSSKDYQHGTVVISTFLTQNYESLEQQRALRELQESSGGRLRLLSICLNPEADECKRTMQREDISWQVICDGKMMDNQLVALLALTAVPDNIIVSNGTIKARSLDTPALQSRLKNLK